MESFSITCTTCRARLRVRDESAIGQILACPKCGSMVLVEAPGTAAEHPGAASDTPSPPSAGSSSHREGSRAAGTVHSDSTPAPEGSEPGEPPATEGERHQDGESGKDVRSSRPQRTFKFREDFDVPAEPAEGKTPRKPNTPAPPKQSAGFAPEPESLVEQPAADDSPVPPAAATSPTTRRYQQWLLIGAAALLGLILAVLMVGIFASGGAGNGTARVESPNGAAPGRNDAPGPPKANGPKRTTDNGLAAKNGGQETKKRDIEEKPVPDAKKSTDLKGSPQPADPEGKTDDEDSADAKNAHAEPVEKKGSGSEDAKPSSTASPDPADDESPPDTAPPDAVEDNGAEGKAAGPNLFTDPSDSTSTASAKPAAKADIPPPDGAAGMSEAETRDRLSTPLVAIEHSQIPLADFAEFVSGLTAVPVTLDVDALPPLGITADTPLAFDLRSVTIKEVLEAALEPVGLNYSVKPGHILITADEPLREKRSTRTYDVADLADDAEAADGLAAHVTSLIANRSWEREGGDATLSVKHQSLEVRQTEMVHFRIARFLDRLRAARGLPPRGDLRSEWLEIPPAFVRAAAELNTPLTAIFIQPTPLGQILDYIETEANLRILTDWRALGELNLTPSFSQPIKLSEQPLRELLDSWLASMELGYRVLDAHTVQISSRAAITARPELELYPVNGERDDENKDLVAEIKAHVGTSFFSDAESPGAIAYDSASNCLLVSLPQPQQRAVFAWLRQHDKVDFDVNGTDE
ncbi:MAG: hypothetical protein R6U98_22880 [Pirellulaceae bacterium]